MFNFKRLPHFNVIEGVALSNSCDYSFGDQAGVICKVPGGFMKKANISNKEFIKKYEEIKLKRTYMTLFIDNIRLYKREIKTTQKSDQVWVNQLMEENSLLDLCAQIPDMNFIIFTNLEDTPIDKYIENIIPDNVLSIHAVNGLFYRHPKIHPFPYGLQRKMRAKDTRLSKIQRYIFSDLPPENLLYVNHSERTNVRERKGVKELFIDKPWARVESSVIDYESLLAKVKQHKFMICPIGNAVDCHRNWETLYLKRVPVMKKNDYLELLFKDYPVLFVDNYSDITESLLIQNNHLYREAQQIDFNTLDLHKVFNSIIKTQVSQHFTI